MDDAVTVEDVELDDDMPAALREDARGVCIAVDLRKGPEAMRALSALLTERFTSRDWSRPWMKS